MGLQADFRQERAPRLALTLRFGDKPRTVALRGWAAAGVALLVAALGGWYFVASLYLVFHDQLLAALMARQEAAQYAYEDRIATLGTQLDQQTNRALLDRHTLETTVRDLDERSTRLAARAALLDTLVARAALPFAANVTAVPANPKVRPFSPASRNPLLAGRPGPENPALPNIASSYASPEPPPVADGSRLEAVPLRGEEGALQDDAPRRDGEGRRAEAGEPALFGGAVEAALSRAEHDQSETLAALRDPALRLVARFKAAFAAVGVPADAPERAVGGPFVPLPNAAGSFEQDAALIQDALLQADHLAALADKVPLRQPLPGALEVTSGFGARLDPFLGRPAMHTGLDLRDYGAAVRATARGTVTIAAAEGGYGTMVEIAHGGGLVTRYAHLANASVVPGERVEAGGVIGHVGSSGRATGPHLHYETRIGGEPVDPARFLKAGARLFDPL